MKVKEYLETTKHKICCQRETPDISKQISEALHIWNPIVGIAVILPGRREAHRWDNNGKSRPARKMDLNIEEHRSIRHASHLASGLARSGGSCILSVVVYLFSYHRLSTFIQQCQASLPGLPGIAVKGVRSKIYPSVNSVYTR